MDKSSVLFATIVASATATLAMGLWARLPFVLAPGMEMNAYVAFFAVGFLGLTWQDALGAVFWSGVICLVLTICRVRSQIIDAIPPNMKSGLALSVGVFLALVALKISGILIYNGVTIEGTGDLLSPTALLLIFSTAIILLLDKLKVPGAVLTSIVLSSVACHLFGFGIDFDDPAEVSGAMLGGIGRFSMLAILDPRVLSLVLILFLIDFYGSIAKLIGLSTSTNIVELGKLPRFKEALLVDGYATCVGSFLGTTSVTTYVESGVGIAAGGRTGLTAVVCGLLMTLCFLIAPLLGFIPIVATTGALIFVAIKLCPSLGDFRRYGLRDKAMILAMQIIVVATFAIDRAILIGFIVYIFWDLISRRKPNAYMVGSAVVLAIGVLMQIITK